MKNYSALGAFYGDYNGENRKKYIKMKQIIYFWNRLYYGMFDSNRRMDVFLYKYVHSLIRSLYNLTHKQKISKQRDKTNFNKAISALSDPIISTNAMLADIEIVWFTGLLTYTLINLMSILIPEVSLVGVDKKTFFIITAIPCITINYLFLWRKKKYLVYFEVFQKGSQKLNTIWCFISMICFVLAWGFFIFSLCIM